MEEGLCVDKCKKVLYSYAIKNANCIDVGKWQLIKQEISVNIKFSSLKKANKNKDSYPHMLPQESSRQSQIPTFCNVQIWIQ